MSSKFSSPFMAKSPLNNVGVLGKLVKTFASAAKQYGRKALGKTKKKAVDPYGKQREKLIKGGMSQDEAMNRFPTKQHFEDTATPEQVKAISKAAGVDVPGDILSYHPKFRQTVIDNYNKTLKK